MIPTSWLITKTGILLTDSYTAIFESWALSFSSAVGSPYFRYITSFESQSKFFTLKVYVYIVSKLFLIPLPTYNLKS